MPFTSPLAGGGGAIIRTVFKSPDYVAGVSGWAIFRDGSAEFNNITARGTLLIKSGNAIIQGTVSGTPIIFFNPNTTVYDTNGYVVAVAVDANTAQMALVAPSNGGHTAGITLQSGATDAVTRALISGGSTRTQNYLFEGAAAEATVTANSAAVAPNNVLDVVTVAVVAGRANQAFEIKGYWHGVGFVTPVAFPGNQMTMRLTRNGTQIASCRILGQNTALTQFGGVLVKEDNPGVGTHTYALSIQHEAGSTAASVHTVATANSPSGISARGFTDTLA